MSQGADSVKSIFFALGANSAIAISKLVAAAITGSGSMMAESVHSMADCGNQLLLLLGIKHAKRPPSPDYPLGFGKAIYFWSFIVALMLFSMGGLFSIYEGIHKLRHPQPLSYPYVAVGVLLFSIIAESVSMWGCLREVNKERRGRSLMRWFRETRQSELLVVFGEDLAALLGLSFALIAVVLTMITGNPLYDAGGSIVIGVLLLVIALMIGIQVQALLIGQSVEPEQRTQMLEFLKKRKEIDQIFSLLTLQLGKDVMVAIKAKMAAMDSAEALVKAINRCEADLKQAFPQVLWLFFEPDLED
ncbi:MAG: cation diffusion facilitator family transporter [Desulfobacterales bacterium]|uniref:Cation diffusion facilitator family transporter n=1 Tax=Candidatus Desulfatibia vada TaxID=2841696 RepID=A0A8J6TTL8_9BACT|nr:cation diffusion facilitator family transporter [Candidatus Desulfatibia vada]MBL6972171.1 cation diffusion facilitator family transporter [Desulfobacterales bacterium]